MKYSQQVYHILIKPICLGTAGSRPGIHSGTPVDKEMPAQESQWLLWPAEVPAEEYEGRSITLNTARIKNPCMEEGALMS